MEKIVYLFAQRVVFPMIRLLFTRRVVGVGDLPATGPYIIAANHSSYMDHFLLAAMARKERGSKLYFLTRSEAFEGYWSNLWHRSTGCVPVDRANPEIASFRTMLGILKRGDIVVIYPEGTRSPDGTPLPPKPGVVKLALHADVPIIPIGIHGAHKILPKGKLMPRPRRALLSIGRPINIGERMTDSKSKEETEKVLLYLMSEIHRLASTHEVSHETSVPGASPTVVPE